MIQWTRLLDSSDHGRNSKETPRPRLNHRGMGHASASCDEKFPSVDEKRKEREKERKREKKDEDSN